MYISNYLSNYSFDSELKADSCRFLWILVEFRNSGPFLWIPLEFLDSGPFLWIPSEFLDSSGIPGGIISIVPLSHEPSPQRNGIMKSTTENFSV